MPLYVLLGLLQGLTEFLPVSSSAHLLIAEHWLHMPPHGASLEVGVHVATLFAVLVVYFRDVVGIFTQRRWRYLGLLAVATVVTVVLALPAKNYMEWLIHQPFAARLCGLLLLFTAAWLLIAERQARRQPSTRPLGWMGAVWVGIAQAVSVLPGISRSGATIGMGMVLGVEREEAARFSFLLSVPVILGAAALKVRDLPSELGAHGIDPLGLAVAFIVALVTGVLAIRLLLIVLKQARLWYFAVYCLALGILAVVIG